MHYSYVFLTNMNVTKESNTLKRMHLIHPACKTHVKLTHVNHTWEYKTMSITHGLYTSGAYKIFATLKEHQLIACNRVLLLLSNKAKYRGDGDASLINYYILIKHKSQFN